MHFQREIGGESIKRPFFDMVMTGREDLVRQGIQMLALLELGINLDKEDIDVGTAFARVYDGDDERNGVKQDVLQQVKIGNIRKAIDLVKRVLKQEIGLDREAT